MSTEGHSGKERDGDQMLAAEYALDVLTGEERARAERRIASEPAFARLVKHWQTRLAGLDNEFGEVPPPAHVLANIETTLFGGARKRGFLSGLWNEIAVWRGLAGAAAAVAVVAIGVNAFRPAVTSPQEFAVQLVAALQAQQGSGVEFVALYDATAGTVRLVGLSGARVPDRDYELWYIQRGEPEVSMGIINVDQRTELAVDATARSRIDAGTVLAVSIEPRGGSPTGRATGPVVALGPVTEI